MSRSPANIARRHGLASPGLGGELTHDAIEDAQRGMRGWQGVVPARFVNAEHVQTFEGHQALITFDLPEGSIQLAISHADGLALAEKLHTASTAARRGLFVPQPNTRSKPNGQSS